MLFCFCNCIFVTVKIVCKGITLYRHMPFVYPFKQFDNNNNNNSVHTVNVWGAFACIACTVLHYNNFISLTHTLATIIDACY